MQIWFSCELPEVLLNVNLSLRLHYCVPRLFSPGLCLCLSVKVLIFSNMDQEMISLVCLWKSNKHLYWAFCSPRLRVFCSQSHHWHIPSVTKEQADVTEFPFQRWEHGAEEDLASHLNVAAEQTTCKTRGGTHFPLPSFPLVLGWSPIIIISVISTI